MQHIGAFTPQATPAGSFNIQYSHGHFLFVNESYSNLLIRLEYDSFALQSGQCRMICINQSGPIINYSTLSTLQIANAVDAVLVEYYAPGEKYLETYPSTLTRQAVIGNVVQTSGGSMANLINDGNAVGTQIIESTPTGDASSAISILNDATMTFGNASRAGSMTFNGNFTFYANQSGVLHQILQARTAGKSLYIGNGTDNVEVLLNLDVDNNLYVAGRSTLDNGAITTDGAGGITLPNNTPLRIKEAGGTARDIVYVDSNDDINIQQAGSSKDINFKNNAGTKILWIDFSDTYNDGQLYDKYTNRISGTSKFTGTGTGTYNHSFQHFTPSAIFICPNVNGSATIGVDSIGATTCHVTIGIAVDFYGLATHT